MSQFDPKPFQDNSKENPKLCIVGPLWGDPQMITMAESPFMAWRLHVFGGVVIHWLDGNGGLTQN